MLNQTNYYYDLSTIDTGNNTIIDNDIKIRSILSNCEQFMRRRFNSIFKYNRKLVLFLVIALYLSFFQSLRKAYDLIIIPLQSRTTDVSFILYLWIIITNRNTYSIDDEQYVCSKRKDNVTSHLLTSEISLSFLSIAHKYSLSNTIIVSIKSLSINCTQGETCKEYTVLTLLAMYRRLYGINVVVFTNDTNTIQVSKEFGFIDHRIIHYNEYGLPYLKYLFLDAMTVSKTRLYTYINADIFVNINILQAAEAYYQYRKDGVLIERITNKQWLLCSRVFVTKSIIHASNVTQRMDIDELARKHSVQRLRVARAIVQNGR